MQALLSVAHFFFAEVEEARTSTAFFTNFTNKKKAVRGEALYLLRRRMNCSIDDVGAT